MAKRRWWRHTLMALLTVVAGIYLFSIPYNRYDWMLADPQALRDGLSYCTLPRDDSEPAMESLLFLLPLVLIATVCSLLYRRLPTSAWYALGWLALWGLRFFVFAPQCPG